MSRVQQYLVKTNWMLLMSLLLGSPVISRANEKTDTVSAGACTSQTGLHCEVYGKEDGDPILALHGLGSSTYTWRNVIVDPYLVKNYRLILVDLRGAGKSPKPHDKHYSILEQADLIYQFIREKDLKNLTLIGNSYGGAVSLLLAIKLCEQDPGRFSKLILIDSGGYNKRLPSHLKLLRTPILGLLVLYILSPRTSSRMILKKGYYDEKKVSEDQVEAYAGPIAAKGGRYALYQTARQAIPKNIDEITSKYKTIEVPTLILWGRQDKIIPLEIGEQLRSDIPNSKLEIIDHAGHMPQEEVPEKVIPLIVEFMKSPT